MRSGHIVIASALLLAPAAWSEQDLLSLRGEWIQGGVVRGALAPGARLAIAQAGTTRSVPTLADGRFVFGLGREATTTITLRVARDNRPARDYRYPVRKRRYNVQHIDRLPASKVDVKDEDLARIRAEALAIHSARDTLLARNYFDQSFIWPTEGVITGVYGSRRVLNGKPRRPHYGIDIAAPAGTPVRAPASGVVAYYNPDMFFSGMTLVLNHGNGLSSTFLHLQKSHVREGDFVPQGKVFAEVGASGRATGAHLDWRVNWFHVRVDPFLLLSKALRARSVAILQPVFE